MFDLGDILEDDLLAVSKVDFINWDKIRKSTILVTGATGLIGTSLIKTLNYANKIKNLDIKILGLVRDQKRAEDRFADILNDGILTFIVGNVENLPEINESVEYIIHGASQTASKEFVSHAVETINTSVLGTFNLLKLAKEKKVKGFVYLSSMEVYGYPENGHKVTEDEIGSMSPLNLRNSYPISKIVSESMTCAYAVEYNVPAMICRLTQTYGPDVNYNDNRVVAYFRKCVKEKKNIVLKTKGESKRSYLHVLDAATAILTIMLKGEPGAAYNVADENTYCSIAEMAEEIAASSGIKVEYDVQDEAANGFPQTLYMDLDTAALKALGWMPRMLINHLRQ